MSKQERKKRRLGLSSWILIGIVAGIAVGLFLGEPAAKLKPFGDAFIRLLQMSILPYMVMALIGGLGSLSYREAGLLAGRGGAVMVLFWVVGFAIILALPLTFPALETASFFSTSAIQPRVTPDFVSLYIPSNPFHSLANNVIPAVVVFCLATGVALIGFEEKEKLVGPVQLASKALARVAHYVVYMTPIGVFAISAGAAGTMTLSEFDRLNVYFVGFIVATCLLTFLVLPALVAILTPFRFKDVLAISRDSMLTGFATGNLFVVLPIIVENSKELFRRYDLAREDTDTFVDVIIPVSFNFPNLGKLLILFFIPFAGWYSGNALALGDYPGFVLLGLVSFFGGIDLAIPFLLDTMRIPADLYQLYLVTGVITGRFATLLGVINLLTFTLVAVAAVSGIARLNRAKLVTLGGASVALSLIALLGTGAFLGLIVDQSYTKDRVVSTMQLLEHPLTPRVYDEPPPAPSAEEAALTAIDRAIERDTLTVGFIPDNLPFSYTNAAGQLVGHDIELAHRLARSLELELDLVAVPRDGFESYLDDGRVDVVVSGLVPTPSRALAVGFTEPYMDVNLALVVRDHEAKDFASYEAVRQMRGLRVALPNADAYLGRLLRHALPYAELVAIDGPRAFFDLNFAGARAVAMSAEAGAAWTLLNPAYEMVIPGPDTLSLPLSWAVRRDDDRTLNVLNAWMAVNRRDGTLEAVYDYWILGQGAEETGPRWSIMRDVLGWGHREDDEDPEGKEAEPAAGDAQ